MTAHITERYDLSRASRKSVGLGNAPDRVEPMAAVPRRQRRYNGRNWKDSMRCDSTEAEMQFFNFGNPQTFHCFQLITKSERIKPLNLVQQALNRVEKNEWFEMGMDVSFAAKDELVKLLEELLSEEVMDWSDKHGLDLAIERGDGGVNNAAYNYPDALFEPLIESAIESIDVYAVAEAMLIHAGKWAPDLDRPEIK